MMDAKTFKKGFHEGQTWGDADKLIEQLDEETAKRLFKALKLVDAYFGLDMRSEFFMREIQFAFEIKG